MSDSTGKTRRRFLATLEATIGERLPAEQAQQLSRFVNRYYARVPEELLVKRDPMDLYGAALAHWDFARRRRSQQSLVRIYNPSLEESGWECTHTVVEVVTEDMPFLVDSLRMGLNRHGLRVLSIIHPIIPLQRDPQGQITAVADAGTPEAFIHLEVERRTGPQLLEELRAELRQVLADVRLAVSDWEPMQQTLGRVLEEIEAASSPLEPDQVEEGCAFLRWMGEHHFTFLGYRAYNLAGEGEQQTLEIEPGTGLGILREQPGEKRSRSFSELPPELRRLAREPALLVLTKANARSTVHRPGNLDYVGVKRFDAAGRVSGEHRFLGLYGSRAYSSIPQQIPLLRRKVAAVLERPGFPPNSHSAKALQHILESYPRDELFQTDADLLYDICSGILQLSEQQRPRLFLRRDLFDRFIICLMYVPRERYGTPTRKRMQAILAEELNGAEVEFSVSVSEATMARVLFTVRIGPGGIPDYDVHRIEARLVDAIHSWQDHLQAALLEHLGEERGSTLFQRFGEAFPAGYREDFTARAAVHDIEQILSLETGRELAMSLYRPLEAAPGRLRFKVFRRRDQLPLSQALPILEHMAVRVEDERPYRVEPADGETLWVHDFGLAYTGSEALDTGEIRLLFQDAFARVWDGSLADDGFNALVLKAHLDWRRIGLLRAYAKYLRQTALTYSQPYMEEAMAANPHIARDLVELFEARFDPARPKQVQQRVTRLTTRIQEALDAVASLDHDRILRGFLALVLATLRSNYFQTAEAGTPRPTLALKLDPSRIPDLPRPLPKYEIFVYSPRVEGVHLRGGKVARGGLRWSDRREDFRTEVLGLMKAQLVKNAVIVPVGAKGGFVVKKPPADDRQALRKEVEQCYRHFISGLLDLTDNLQEDRCIPPDRLVRYDDDDPYLVVAADKGTATFSDLANQVAAGYRFWLGDAFASGGRAGYDHKKMGITARGAWEAVRQHFQAAGIDYRNQPFSVVGIGDMSGDVFGNGLLWSRQTRLLAAFDHRHVFLDPDPDPESSFEERRRLFQLPVSSWADYDPALISAGGGVYARSLKSIHLSEQARQALAIDAEALPPDDLIRALLKAPVDLLWNGGIGTYVKASWERNADVDDRGNDNLRINAAALRCKVVGEGGNLGLTQGARIEYAELGGRIDTDFIHNAGGVNCSDHEVNIKILLDRVVADGELTSKQRDRLLAQMTDEVAALVLQDSYWQTCAIGLDQARAAALLPLHRRLMRHLERSGQLDRALEFLPDDAALHRRQSAGLGLTRPELALLVSYAKHSLTQELLASDLPEDTCMGPELERYFPSPLRQSYRERIHQHRLRREILAASLSNRLVNRFGSTFAFALQEELGVNAADLARAYAAVWEIYGLARLWSAVAKLDTAIPDAIRIDLLLRAVRLATRACRWLLQRHAGRLRTAQCIERYREPVQGLSTALPELLDPQMREALETAAAPLLEAGVPRELAQRAVGLEPLFRALDLVEVAAEADVAVGETAQVYFGLGAELELGWLERSCTALPAQDRWHASARANLRDELQSQHRELCAAVLRGAMDTTSAQSKLEAWRRQRHAALERYRRLLEELQAQDEIDMAMLTVLLRELRQLAADGLPGSGVGSETVL